MRLKLLHFGPVVLFLTLFYLDFIFTYWAKKLACSTKGSNQHVSIQHLVHVQYCAKKNRIKSMIKILAIS